MPWLEAFGAWEVPLVLLLLAAALAVLPLLAGIVVSDWHAVPREGWLGRRSWWASLLVASVVRALAPHAIVTMYIGYQLAEQAMRLATESRYGVASHAFYHVLYGFLPHDHRVLWWANSVLGVLSIPVWSTLAGRLLRDRRAAVLFAWIWALLPLYIKNDNSDANNVPLHFWLGGGLLAWSEWLATGARHAWLTSLPLLALAFISRPEQPLLLPILWLGVSAVLAPPRQRLRQRLTWFAPVLVLLLGIPHIAHVAGAVQTLQDRASLPGFEPHALADLPKLLLSRMNTMLEPRLYPALLLGAAALAFVPAPSRRARLALLALAIAAIATYSLDLCRANMARVHVLGSLFVSMLAAAGLAEALRRWPGRRGAVLVGAVALSALPSVAFLWQPTNEEAEEALIREAIAALPESPVRFLRIADDDGSHEPVRVWRTHRHFPDYLVLGIDAETTVESITSFLRNPSFDRPVYAFLGFRCYAEFRDDGVPPPHGAYEQPACQRLHAAFPLQPVVARDAVNHGDVWLNYYGDAPTLHVGLYRVLPPPATPAR